MSRSSRREHELPGKIRTCPLQRWYRKHNPYPLFAQRCRPPGNEGSDSPMRLSRTNWVSLKKAKPCQYSCSPTKPRRTFSSSTACVTPEMDGKQELTSRRSSDLQLRTSVLFPRTPHLRLIRPGSFESPWRPFMLPTGELHLMVSCLFWLVQNSCLIFSGG